MISNPDNSNNVENFITDRDEVGNIVLHKAARTHNFQPFEFLSPYMMNSLDVRNEQEFPVLHVAAQNKEINVLNKVIETLESTQILRYQSVNANKPNSFSCSCDIHKQTLK